MVVKKVEAFKTSNAGNHYRPITVSHEDQSFNLAVRGEVADDIAGLEGSTILAQFDLRQYGTKFALNILEFEVLEQDGDVPF